MAEISVILPAYNEANRIENAVLRTVETVSRVTNSYEIIIAEDGSTDGTDHIAAKLAENENVVHLHSDDRQGRGKALARSIKSSSGSTIAYMDVDLATDTKHITELIDAVRVEGYDFATGSRLMPDSKVRRSLKRDVASRGYNLLVRFLLKSKIHDHQCGFKSFKREALLSLLDKIKDEHWFWDTELLVRAQQQGYKIKEFSVKWKHGGPTKVNFMQDIIGMGSQIFRLRRELKR